MAAIAALAQRTHGLSWAVHAGLFLVGYVGQEVAHHATGEPTMQVGTQQAS